MKKLLIGAFGMILLLSAMATPALANNDPFVPADNCSGNSNVVGQPQGGPGSPAALNGQNANSLGQALNRGGVDANPVGPGVASASNPGVSTGARGQARATSSPGNCTAHLG